MGRCYLHCWCYLFCPSPDFNTESSFRKSNNNFRNWEKEREVFLSTILFRKSSSVRYFFTIFQVKSGLIGNCASLEFYIYMLCLSRKICRRMLCNSFFILKLKVCKIVPVEIFLVVLKLSRGCCLWLCMLSFLMYISFSNSNSCWYPSSNNDDHHYQQQ